MNLYDFQSVVAKNKCNFVPRKHKPLKIETHMEQNAFYQEEENMSKYDIVVGVSIAVSFIIWTTVMFL